MRRYRFIASAFVGLMALSSCESLPEPRHVTADRPGESPAASLREPRYVQADQPGNSPITPLLQNRAPWSPTAFAPPPAETAPPYAPVAPSLGGGKAESPTLFAETQPDRRYSTQVRSLLARSRDSRPGPLFGDPSARVAAAPRKVETIEPKIATPATTAQACWESAEALEKLGEFEHALRQYTQAVELQPSLAGKAARRTARLHDKLGHSEKAWRAYQAALHESPNDADLLVAIGQFYYKRGGVAESERWFRMALQIDANHVRAWKSFGIALAAQGKMRDSFRALRRVMSDAEAQDILSAAGEDAPAENAATNAAAPVQSASHATGKNPF